MIRLKPCPFCGRIPEAVDCGGQYFVKCSCGINQDNLYYQKYDAVKAWNKRKCVTEERWVPCAERQPETSGRYLVCLRASEEESISVLNYGVPDRSRARAWYRTDREWGDVTYSNVLAWMPLPEPYTTEKEAE